MLLNQFSLKLIRSPDRIEFPLIFEVYVHSMMRLHATHREVKHDTNTIYSTKENKNPKSCSWLMSNTIQSC